MEIPSSLSPILPPPLDIPDLHIWLSLADIERFVPLARNKRVVPKVRGRGGFLGVYRSCDGSRALMAQLKKGKSARVTWEQARDREVRRRYQQMLERNQLLWENGQPTKAHLALIMYAYTPDWLGVQDWINEKEEAKRKRNKRKKAKQRKTRETKK